jgi:hypothetical protein
VDRLTLPWKYMILLRYNARKNELDGDIIETEYAGGFLRIRSSDVCDNGKLKSEGKCYTSHVFNVQHFVSSLSAQLTQQDHLPYLLSSHIPIRSMSDTFS